MIKIKTKKLQQWKLNHQNKWTWSQTNWFDRKHEENHISCKVSYISQVRPGLVQKRQDFKGLWRILHIQHSHRRCQQHTERLLVWYRDFDNMRSVYVCLASVLQNRIMGFIGSREVEWYQEVLDAAYDPWVLRIRPQMRSQSDLHINLICTFQNHSAREQCFQLPTSRPVFPRHPNSRAGPQTF